MEGRAAASRVRPDPTFLGMDSPLMTMSGGCLKSGFAGTATPPFWARRAVPAETEEAAWDTAAAPVAIRPAAWDAARGGARTGDGADLGTDLNGARGGPRGRRGAAFAAAGPARLEGAPCDLLRGGGSLGRGGVETGAGAGPDLGEGGAPSGGGLRFDTAPDFEIWSALEAARSTAPAALSIPRWAAFRNRFKAPTAPPGDAGFPDGGAGAAGRGTPGPLGRSGDAGGSETFCHKMPEPGETTKV